MRGVLGRRKQERARDWTSGEEPRPEGEDWQEYGGELMWVAGFTEGGAPYGLTVDEFRLANERDAGDAGNAGWARAKWVLKELLEMWSGPPTRADVGLVRNIAHGLSRDIFAAEVELTPDRSCDSGPYVVLLPRRGADDHLDDRAQRELRLLGRLSHLTLPFSVPAEPPPPRPESCCVRSMPVLGDLAVRSGPSDKPSFRERARTRRGKRLEEEDRWAGPNTTTRISPHWTS
jgi:hypothetical protein